MIQKSIYRWWPRLVKGLKGVAGNSVPSCKEPQLGFNWERFKIDSTGQSINIFELRTQLGLRNNIYDNVVYFIYGFEGSYGFRSHNSNSSTNPYSTGVFIGLNYQPINQILLTFSINPYNYSVSPSKTKKNSIFETGAIGVSYVFN